MRPDGLPARWRNLQYHAGPALKYGGIPERQPDCTHFGLRPRAAAKDDALDVLLFADSQTSSVKDVDYYWRDIVQPLVGKHGAALGLTLGDELFGLSQIDLLLTDSAQDALALSQHSRNLLLVERKVSDDALIRQRARIRPIASPEGACCVERLMEPYPSMLERQLARMHERQIKT